MKKQLGLVALVIAGVGLVASAAFIKSNDINLNRNEKQPTSSVLNTIWIINNNPTTDGDIETYNINFESNNQNYTKLEIKYEGSIYQLNYNTTSVYASVNGGTWTNNAYKTIYITGGADTTNASLIAWLDDNATYISSESPDVENQITTLTRSTWRFNEDINIPSTTKTYSIIYQSNNSNYTELYTTKEGTLGMLYYVQEGGDPERTNVFTSATGFSSYNARIIYFENGYDIANTELINWLYKNAILLGSPEPEQPTSQPSGPTSEPLYNVANTVWQFNNHLYDPNGTYTYMLNFDAFYQRYYAIKFEHFIELPTEGYRLLYYYYADDGRQLSNEVYTYRWEWDLSDPENPEQIIYENWSEVHQIITIYNGADIANPYFIQFLLNNATQMTYNPPTTSGTSIQPETPQITQEIVPIASVMWDVIAMPFTFISTGFNVTLFAGTDYAVNVGALFLGLLGMVAMLVVIKVIIKVFK